MEGAFVQLGKSRKPVISIDGYYSDGTCLATIETVLPNGYSACISRRVSLKSIYLPSPAQDEILECQQLVSALQQLARVTVEELLPLTDHERGMVVRAKLLDAGIDGLQAAINTLHRRGDLLQIIPVIHILSAESCARDEQRRSFRLAALNSYQRRQVGKAKQS